MTHPFVEPFIAGPIWYVKQVYIARSVPWSEDFWRTIENNIKSIEKLLTLNLINFNEWFGGCFKSKQLALEKESEDKKQDAMSRQ